MKHKFVFVALLVSAAASGMAKGQNLVVSPLNYGATCNGTGDDGVGINAALAYLRSQATGGRPLTGILQLPAGQCTLQTTVNATGLIGGSVVIQGTGGSLLCKTNGTQCIDATNSSELTFRDITITGSSTNMPNIGLQVARPSTTGSAADMHLDHITMSGYFSLADFYNLNAETQVVNKLNVQNSAPGGYGAIYDGYNHFNAQSAFSPITEPVDVEESFGDNTCISCRIGSLGTGGIPLWVGGTYGLTFVNSYISQFNTGVAVVLYNYNINPHFDAHIEATGLTSNFLLTGSVHPVLYGMIYREHDFFGMVSMFALDAGVRVATLYNVDLSIGAMHTTGLWFDNAANYTVSGRVAGYNTNGWVSPGGGFSGTTCFAATCTTH